MQAQRDSLIAEVASILDPADTKHAERIVDSFCRLSPPMTRPAVSHMITLHSGGLQGGETSKPGNLRLNWHRFAAECGDMVLTVAGVINMPMLVPFAALSLWNKYWTQSTIKLSREQATALFAMWTRKNERNRIARSDAITAINELLTVFKLPLIDDSAFNAIECELIHLQCIESDDDGIWLREWVMTTYG
jgi:hypothetical protein